MHGIEGLIVSDREHRAVEEMLRNAMSAIAQALTDTQTPLEVGIVAMLHIIVDQAKTPEAVDSACDHLRMLYRAKALGTIGTVIEQAPPPALGTDGGDRD